VQKKDDNHLSRDVEVAAKYLRDWEAKVRELTVDQEADRSGRLVKQLLSPQDDDWKFKKVVQSYIIEHLYDQGEAL
jgi:hypothetical protein